MTASAVSRSPAAAGRIREPDGLNSHSAQIVAVPGAGHRRPAPMACHFDGWLVAIGQGQVADHGAGEMLRVANVVEAPELASQLPEPRVVPHPIRTEVNEPGSRMAVVVGGGVAGLACERWIPMHAFGITSGDVQFVAVGQEKPGQPPRRFAAP